MEGLVFIDGDAEIANAQIADYVSYGPNNEVYIASGQSVAFIIDTPSNYKNVHIGIKSADGIPGTYTIKNIAKETKTVDNKTVEAGTIYGEKLFEVNTSTDMYYDLTGWKNDIIVISNIGSTGVISLTNIKSTYESAPNVVSTASEDGTAATEPVLTRIYMTPAAATLTLRSLNTSEPVEDTTGSSGNVEPTPTPDRGETSKPEVNPNPAPTPDAGEDTTKPGVNEDVTTPDDSQTGTTTPEEDKTEGDIPDNENQTPETDSEQTTPDEETEEEPMGFFAWLISVIVGFFKNLFGGLFN